MSEMMRISARNPVDNKYEEIQGTAAGGLLSSGLGNTLGDGTGTNKHMVVTSDGYQRMDIASGNIVNYATDILQGGGMPAALTVGGNFKVSVEEIASGTLATAALQGGGLPAALDASGNLKVSIESGQLIGFATDTLQGGGLPAALSASGNLMVAVEESITSRSTALLLNAVVMSASDLSSALDCSAHKNLRIYGSATAELIVQSSRDNVSYYNVVNVYPDNDNNFSITIDNVPSYIKVKCGLTGQTVTAETELL
jgi:hypothetical protein